MNSAAKLGIVIIVVAIVAVAGASVFYMKGSLNSPLPQVSQAPTPSPIQTPTPTQQPVQVTESPSVPTITVAYYALQTPCGHYAIDVNITNVGYASFNTDPTKFTVTANGSTYGYSKSYTQNYGDWTTMDLGSPASYEGTLIFDASSAATSVTLSYNDTSYNIVYVVR